MLGDNGMKVTIEAIKSLNIPVNLSRKFPFFLSFPPHPHFLETESGLD